MINRPPTRIELKLEDDLIDYEETIMYRKNLKDTSMNGLNFSSNSYSANKNEEINTEMLNNGGLVNNFNFTPNNMINNNLLQSGGGNNQNNNFHSSLTNSHSNSNFNNNPNFNNNFSSNNNISNNLNNFSNFPQPSQYSNFNQINSNINPTAPYYYSNDSLCISPTIRTGNKSMNITRQNIISEFISEEGGEVEEYTEDEYLRNSGGRNRENKERSFMGTPDVSMR
jgi:hypothetical protein